MKSIIRLFGAILALMLILSFNVLAVEEKAGDIIVNITGFQNDEGVAALLLFKSGDGFPMPNDSSVLHGEFIEIHNKSAQTLIAGVPYGEYAITVLHDINHNQSKDPGESFGTSNCLTLNFEEAKFEVKKAETTVNIEVICLD